MASCVCVLSPCAAIESVGLDWRGVSSSVAAGAGAGGPSPAASRSLFFSGLDAPSDSKGDSKGETKASSAQSFSYGQSMLSLTAFNRSLLYEDFGRCSDVTLVVDGRQRTAAAVFCCRAC